MAAPLPVFEARGLTKVYHMGEVEVHAVRDGRAVQTTVHVGQRNAVEAEVLSGLAEGAHVIVHPGNTVADGVSVTQR